VAAGFKEPFALLAPGLFAVVVAVIALVASLIVFRKSSV
jgi:hypothetical protein